MRKYKYSSLMYADLTEYELIEKDELRLYKSDTLEPKYHFECDDLDTLLKHLDKKASLSFVPNEWIERLKEEGFKVLHHYSDYFTTNFSVSGPYKMIDASYAAELETIVKSVFEHDKEHDEMWFKAWYDEKKQEMTRTNILGVFENSVLVGFVCVALYGPAPTLWIRLIAVLPEHQGKGYGKALMIGALTYGRYRGARKSYLAVDAQRDKAISLYRKLNYKAGDDEQIDMKRE